MINFRIELGRLGTKITLIFFLGLLIISCGGLKQNNSKRLLLTQNEIVVNDKEVKKLVLSEIPIQSPNEKILGFRFQLALHRLAVEKPDSLYYNWLDNHPVNKKILSSVFSEKQTYRIGESYMVLGWSNMFRELGEPPRYLNETKTTVSNKRFDNYYSRRGYFNATTTSEVFPNKRNTKAKVVYTINTGAQYVIDSLKSTIQSPELQPLYDEIVSESKIINSETYSVKKLEEERERITRYFRDKGVYHFQTNNITYKIDTVNTGHKAAVSMLVKDRVVISGDTTKTLPFRIYKISRVNVVIDPQSKDLDNEHIDSSMYNGVYYYHYGKMSHRPKALSKAIFLKENQLYSDSFRNLTNRAISNLKVFQYPTIQYVVDESAKDPSLIANIFLKPRERYGISPEISVIHSDIEDVGFTFDTSLSIRNVFKGAEILEISGRGNVGSSSDLKRDDHVFFNLSEYGVDAKLNVPRLLTPIGFKKWVPKRMFPKTLFSLGFFKQHNIGLDKQNFVGLVSYSWEPKTNKKVQFDLFNVQYIRNVNNSNYFNIYQSSYERLNDIGKIYADVDYRDTNGDLLIESGTNAFISDVLSGSTPLTILDESFVEVRRINERKSRLTENNFIAASNFQYRISSKKNLADESYYELNTKVESAGLLMSLLSQFDDTNKDLTQNRQLYSVEYSQYGKFELEYIKHWDLLKKNIIAFRYFSGVAIPYGNSTNIPFSRSYFAGGANDNRAWQPYTLGPGKSSSLNDFNEANFKIALNLEYRFPIYNSFYGALFIDVGNIWNLEDDTEDSDYIFEGINSLNELAVGSGFGLRYDFEFFVFRADLGFKNYNPSNSIIKNWNNKYPINSSVINIGINYPF